MVEREQCGYALWLSIFGDDGEIYFDLTKGARLVSIKPILRHIHLESQRNLKPTLGLYLLKNVKSMNITTTSIAEKPNENEGAKERKYKPEDYDITTKAYEKRAEKNKARHHLTIS